MLHLVPGLNLRRCNDGFLENQSSPILPDLLVVPQSILRVFQVCLVAPVLIGNGPGTSSKASIPVLPSSEAQSLPCSVCFGRSPRVRAT